MEVTFDGPAPVSHATPQRGLKTESSQTFEIPTIEVVEVSHKQRAAPVRQGQVYTSTVEQHGASTLQHKAPPIESLVGENMAQFDIKPSFQQDIRHQVTDLVL